MLLEMKHISKSFHGVQALKDVDLSLKAGEVRGLVGENGAGKSTLIKLLTGVYRRGKGEILWNGQAVALSSPAQSQALGIQAIHQDRTLISTFDGIENAYLGLSYPIRHGKIDWKTMENRVRTTMESLGLELDLHKAAAELPPPQRTCLEIVRARMRECRLLILDEPTAALTEREAERLFSVVRALKESGAAILYVTHRLDEIFRLTDRVTILRNGAVVDTVETAEVNRERLIAMMTDGASVQAPSHASAFGDVLLEARDVTSRDGIVRRGDLFARSGEILGLFGLGGSGRTELLECIYGSRPMASGTVELCGAAQKKPSPASSLDRGAALICEDRRGKALIGSLDVRDNILLTSIDRFAMCGVSCRRAENAAVQAQIDALGIVLASMEQPVAELSGGNQQKTVFARAMMTNPRVLLCDEPTQAVDVKTRGEIHRLLRQKADEGCVVVFVSSDLGEVLEVADTVQVMRRGETGPRMENKNLTVRQVLSCCYET
ncbi:sugar ABC transporter ATP-binding protein [Oscillibacter ruminantium]|uniref:sugar ABC transporter ATP-binding protein n=1 Tax=Oscillibacter ruminantium TaxID=1263547 RepID=UPI00331CB1CC